MRKDVGRGAVGWRVLGAAMALMAAVAVVAPASSQASPDPGTAGTASVPPAFRGLAVGSTHSCAILLDGRLKCWGDNFRGQLGVGDTEFRGDEVSDMGASLPTVRLGSGRSAVEVAVGHQHSCALLDNGAVKCWGSNFSWQLGQGPNAQNVVGDSPEEMGDALPAVDLGTGRTAVDIATGMEHTCAVLDNGDLKCWGDNDEGQLGQGDTEDRGYFADTMGDGLPPIDLGTGRTATEVAVGDTHTCALLDDATVKCWGYGLSGQLGVPLGGPLGDDPGEMGDALPTVDLGTGRTATAISSTALEQRAHTCALLDDGTVKCWGWNIVGQLGLGDTTDRGLVDGTMGDALPAVDLGVGRTAVALAAGPSTTCALLDDDTAKCWGWNIVGQLGQGDDDHRGNEPGEMGDALPAIDVGSGRTIAAISPGNSHTCARLDDGTLRCWGSNYYGELGLGFRHDTESIGDDPGEMGDALPAVDLGDGVPDPPRVCDGQPVTVDLELGDTPTNGDDVIAGTAGPDTISALGGNDVVCSLGGGDTITGGAGRDRLFGGPGVDTLRGGTEDDLLDGGDSDDRLFGDAGVDTLKGGAGADQINGGTENDSVFGGSGNDRVFGVAGNDTLRGEVGLDTLDGGPGNDRLLGGTQRDTCHGRTGRDTQTGCEVRTGIP